MNAQHSQLLHVCWLCGGTDCKLLWQGLSPDHLTSADFAITDSRYGTCLSVFTCGACGFKFCAEAGDMTPHYAALEDPEYERTRGARIRQATDLLASVVVFRKNGTLLDVGAGSGIMIEAALRTGFAATGIEPSEWLCQQARQRGLSITHGIFPDAAKRQAYDIITLVDVLEHVNTPLVMLKAIAAHLSPEGIALVVTPDAGSVMARLLRKRWWHYRIAHLSYFTRDTLSTALAQTQLEPLHWYRPQWHFPLDYLLTRLGQYFPVIARFAQWPWTQRISVPLNLRDSWAVVVRKAV